MRIWVKEGGRYREIDNGPFPVTPEQLDKARKMFAAELAAADCSSRHLDVCRSTPWKL